jgi:hypothetical protein
MTSTPGTNQKFLHARCGLLPYKETINRWLWPDPLSNQDTAVSKAKQAISHYKKAVNDGVGVTELMVSYCEQAAGYCEDLGYQDEGFFDALVNMFEGALKRPTLYPPSPKILSSLDWMCAENKQRLWLQRG